MAIGIMGTAAMLAIGCRFEPGKKFSWSSTIETQFDIFAGEDRQIGYYHFNDPFELDSGKVSLKLGYRADQSQGPSTPTGLTWRLRLYDSTFTTMKFQYDLNAAGKMKQSGCCAYKVSFKGSDAGFTGWNVAAGDNLLWSVIPSGGTLPTGVSLGIRYSYTPN